jgi:hypothetical protein
MKYEVGKMRYKIVKSICLIAIISILMIPSIPANITKQSDITKNTTDEVYHSGWIILVSSSLQGVDEGLHIGGMNDINIIATYQNTLLIRTKPIWGSTIITEDVDIQIQMKHFFGIINKYGDSGEIIGICEDVSWEII